MSIASQWKGLLDRRDVLILDTETTGVGKRSEVLDIALINTCGQVVYSDPVLPQGRIPGSASAVHGLTRARLRAMSAEPWAEHHAAVERCLTGGRVLLAYNLDFDLRLLDQTAERHGFGNIHLPTATRLRCLMLDYAEWRGVPHPWRKGEWKWHRLTEAAGYEGVASVQSHRALDDAKLTLAVMRAVAAKGRGVHGWPSRRRWRLAR